MQKILLINPDVFSWWGLWFLLGEPPPVLIPPRQKRGGEIKPSKNCAKKRCVGNTHSHLGTRLNSDVTSATSPLAIEGVKDGYGKANLACRSVKLEGENGGKEKGAAPAEHTTAPMHSDCLTVDACCECGPMLTCKTTLCECRKDICVCVIFWCLERCVNRAPQTRWEETLIKVATEGKGTGKRKRRWGKRRRKIRHNIQREQELDKRRRWKASTSRPGAQ